MSSFARSARFVVSVILFPFLNCWLRKKPKIFDALGFLRSTLALGFQARNRFFVTRSDNWDAFMLQSKPSIHSQMNIDTYFVLAPLAYTYWTRTDSQKLLDSQLSID
jgi:hypothetical protein